MEVSLAHHAPLLKWKPEIGDFVVWHGWFTHWFGVISEIKADEVTIIKKGMPVLLFSLTQSEYNQNKISIGIEKIKSGGSFWDGKFATIKATGNNLIWFI